MKCLLQVQDGHTETSEPRGFGYELRFKLDDHGVLSVL
jgi:hypothetical protein